MNFVLDTNIVSDLRKPRPNPRLAVWMLHQGWDRLFMSAPTLAELQCGAGKTSDPQLARRVQAWIDGLIATGQPQVIPFGSTAALVLGRMWTTPALNNFIVNDPRSRKVKNGADLSIAACAIQSGMAIATNNDSDFLEIHAAFPLPGLYNPFFDRWPVYPGTP